MSHDGETFGEAADDIETRYGVTVTLVLDGDPPMVDIEGPDLETLERVGEGSWDMSPDAVRSAVTT